MSYEIVEKLNRDFEDYYNNNLLKEAVSTYANDAKLFSNDKQIYQGLNNIQKFYSDAKINGNTNVHLHTEQIIQCDSNYLIEISTYQLNNDSGNSVVIWKKDNEQWKKIIDIFN